MLWTGRSHGNYRGLLDPVDSCFNLRVRKGAIESWFKGPNCQARKRAHESKCAREFRAVRRLCTPHDSGLSDLSGVRDTHICVAPHTIAVNRSRRMSGMRNNSTVFGLALAAAVLAAAPAHPKSRAHRPPRHVALQPRQDQIACTVLGCRRIPAACYPKEQHTASGIPTGFDQIICPPGVWPF
jgi:hypothetical protein